jgi:D-alanyl-D-alanine carboxypeptidase
MKPSPASLRALAIVCFIASGIISQAQPVEKRIQEILDHKIDSLRETLQIPAIAFSCILPSGQLITVSAGMPPEDRMLAGSTGKTFFASLALKYISEQTLALDDLVSRYLKKYKWYKDIPNAETITIKMLMNHTSGIEEYYAFGDFTQRLRNEPDKNWKPEECIAYVLGRQPLFAAGSDWSYADTNYLILGLILEEVSGKKAYDEIQRLFIEPNKLTKTEPSVSRTYPGLVHGITTPNNPFGIAEKMIVNDSLVINPQMEWAGGGFISNTIDLARWAKVYFEGKFIAEQVRMQQQEGVAAKTGKDHKYGLGMQIRPSALGISYGHGGWFPGYLTEMDYFPDHHLSVAIQIATDDFKKLKRSPRFYETFFATEVIKHLK